MKLCPKCKTFSIPADDTCLNCKTHFNYVKPPMTLVNKIELTVFFSAAAVVIWAIYSVWNAKEIL